MEKTVLDSKRVVVMGLGSFGGGEDSAAFACRHGADVIVTDLAEESKLAGTIQKLSQYPITWRLGEHREEDFRRAEVVIVNPAVPPDNKFIQIAREAGSVITSQVQLFFERCGAKTVAITGSNGKSTTTSLAAHLLQLNGPDPFNFSISTAYKRVYLTGNIGNRPLLGLLGELTERDVVVIEISSFQIEQLGASRLGPDIALITNLTPNHLDRHGTFEEYARCKKILFENQPLDEQNPAVSIFNAVDPVCAAWCDEFKTDKGRLCIPFRAEDVPDEIAAAFPLPGRVNRQNLAAAMAVARQFGLEPADLKDSISSFRGLPHRLELVAEIDGVRWYDDSKATTPVSTIAALNGIDEPKILIAGGYDKGISFEGLGNCIAQRAKAAVLIGQTADKIEQAILKSGRNNAIIRKAASMEDAVNYCSQIAQNGDVVLMSPACASYDMFTNYEQRAERFKQSISKIL